MKSKNLNLNTVTGRAKYFQKHAQKEIEEIKEYLDSKTFVGFLLAKKSAGKGTYSKMFQEVIGQDRVVTISIGDLVRETHAKLDENPNNIKELINKLVPNYRGYISLEDSLKAFLDRNQSTLIPSEFILALIKEKLSEFPDKAVFIDGFPRGMDQITYALYFRQIMNLRPDPDFFVLINVPETIIEERIKTRVICPTCNTARNMKLLPSEFADYNKKTKEIFLICDNVDCAGYKKQAMVKKDGDELGLEPIRNRIKNDAELIKQALQLHGIPKVILNNSIPVKDKEKYKEYEITPEFVHKVDEANKKVKVIEKPWIVKDDEGNDSYSLLAAPVVLSMIKQIHSILFSTD